MEVVVYLVFNNLESMHGLTRLGACCICIYIYIYMCVCVCVCVCVFILTPSPSPKVAEVYKAIFAEADNSLGTLQMLTNIETQLEELLAIIDTMPRDEVEAAEKLKEKERRSRVREAKTAEAERAQEERIQRSIRRSQVDIAIGNIVWHVLQ